MLPSVETRTQKRWFSFFFPVFCAWFASFLAQAAELTSGPTISFTNSTQAIIHWKTDVSTGTRVFFGESLQTMLRRVDGPQGINHVAVLPSLEAGTKWFYTVGTARIPLATNSFEVPGAHNRTAVSEKRANSTAVSAAKAPSTRETWGYLPSLQDHFERHGRDFSARDPDDYARLAWEFRRRAASENLPTKVDIDGVIRIYDPRSRAFGAYNKNGTTRTFFKPRSDDYFDRQPGKLTTAKGLK